MAAVALRTKLVRTQNTDEMREGTIDFSSPTWTCGEHRMRMRIGRECPFCAIDEHGDDVLDSLAF